MGGTEKTVKRIIITRQMMCSIDSVEDYLKGKGFDTNGVILTIQNADTGAVSYIQVQE